MVTGIKEWGQGFRSGVGVLEVLKGISGIKDFPMIRKNLPSSNLHGAASIDISSAVKADNLSIFSPRPDGRGTSINCT